MRWTQLAHRRATSSGSLGLVAAAWSAAVVGVMAVALSGDDAGEASAISGGFQHLATFDVTLNGTVEARDLVITDDGGVVVYTDSLRRRLAFVDIGDPAVPAGAGSIALDGVPTDVQVEGDRAFVALDQSTSSAPAGRLDVIDLRTRRPTVTIELRGQPADLAVSPDGSFVAIAIANGGTDAPGRLAVVRTADDVDAWTMRDVEFVGVAGDDPEPAGVAINAESEAVVTLPSSNHVSIVDLVDAVVTRHWSAGRSALRSVDVVEDRLGERGRGVISLDTDVIMDREPTSVAWVDDTVVTADEGVGETGGGRSVTWHGTDGDTVFTTGSSLEWAAAAAGRLDEREGADRGIRPAAVATGLLGDRRIVVAVAEKANLAAVFDSTASPRLVQVLPTGDEPGDVAISEQRGVMAIAAHGQVDGEYPSVITLARWTSDGATAATISSSFDSEGPPIPWSTLSGLSGDPFDPEVVWAVNDGYLAEGAIHRVELDGPTAMITDRVVVRSPDGRPRPDLDLEGVAVVRGGAWLASEGRASDRRPSLLLRVDDDGTVVEEVAVPAIAGSDEVDFGIEGVAVDDLDEPRYVFVAFQRPLPGDPVGSVRIGRYEPVDGTWAFALYPVEGIGDGSVGIADLARRPGGRLAVLERDNRGGPGARIKRVYDVDPSSVEFVGPSERPLVLAKQLLADALDPLSRNSIWVPDNVEGLAVTSEERLFVVSDNDGLDSALGETVFVELAPVR